MFVTLRILQVSDCNRRFSEERVRICTIWNVPAERMFTNFDRTLERTFEPDKRSVVSLSHPDWLITSTDMETAGDNRSPLREGSEFENRVRTGRSYLRY